MNFLVDMPVSPELAGRLRQQGHDAVHASDAGLFDASDVLIMERARSEHRIVVTADLDFSRLLALSGATGPGLILFRGGEHGEAGIVERMESLLRTISPDELSCSIVVIEGWRARKRRLPL